MSDNLIRRLYFGDNLEVMRELPAESVDLVYLDPPFNSKRVYNALFKSPETGVASKAQFEAFEDTWRWTPDVQAQYEWLVSNPKVPASVSKAIEAFQGFLNGSDVMAYLVMMTARLLEIHRLMKPEATMYLHCDPNASHYLKVICDRVFQHGTFINEVIWHYKGAGISPRYWGRRHDVLLWYGKGNKWYFDPDPVRDEYAESTKARFSHYIGNVRGDQDYGQQELNPKGKHPDDVWLLPILAPSSNERIGYPTQKPLHLLERVILSSSRPGDVVFDPFCGCGTTVAAAENLGRSWIGIDITYLAIQLIGKRLEDAHPGVKFQVFGEPRDVEGAAALFKHSHKQFEIWAVSKVGGRANEKKGGDEGNDGVIFFYIDGQKWGRVVVSVKGGGTVNPTMVRELIGTVKNEGADVGVLITRAKPTKGMLQAAAQAGSYTWSPTGQQFEKIQIITIEELLAGKRPDLPPLDSTFAQAPVSRKDRGHQPELLSE